MRVVGHSWGAMTAAAMPAAGLAPARLVLIDPPAVPLAAIAAMLEDPVERSYDDVEEAVDAIGGLYPTWPYGDVIAKAEGLTQFDEAAVRDVLTENGDWDGGLGSLADRGCAGRAGLADPRRSGRSVATSRMQLLPDFVARLGADRVVTIAGAPHSPQRTHPEALVQALLRALGG